MPVSLVLLHVHSCIHTAFTALLTCSQSVYLLFQERMFQFWFNTYFVTETGSNPVSKNGTGFVDLNTKLSEECRTSSSSDMSRVRR